MAQRIWLIRHGKSARPFGVVDHQRPLSARASTDAAAIRGWLKDAPQLYVSSSAKRATETAALLAGERRVETCPALYHASAAEFLDVVEAMLGQANDIAFIGHNPTTTLLVNTLAKRHVTDNVPTLGVAAFERGDAAQAWRLADYVAPKQLR